MGTGAYGVAMPWIRLDYVGTLRMRVRPPGWLAIWPKCWWPCGWLWDPGKDIILSSLVQAKWRHEICNSLMTELWISARVTLDQFFLFFFFNRKNVRKIPHSLLFLFSRSAVGGYPWLAVAKDDSLLPIFLLSTCLRIAFCSPVKMKVLGSMSLFQGELQCPSPL